MSDATVIFLTSRLSIAAVEFFIVGAVVTGILAVCPHVPPRWRRRIWLVVLCKPLITLLTGSFAGYMPVAKVLSNRFLGDLLFPAPAESGPMAEGGTLAFVLRMLVILWLVGASWCLLRVWMRYLGSCRLIDECLEKGYLLKPSALKRLDPNLVIPPRACIIATPEEAGPATIGVFRPAVVIPESLLPWVIQHRDPTPAERQQFAQVLRHELGHIAQRDDLWSLLAAILLSIFWFHPMAHWAYRRLRMNNELCCDETVLDSGVDATDYVTTLMNVVAHGFTRKGLILRILGDTSQAGVIRRRVQYLLSERGRANTGRPLIAYAIVLLLLVSMPRFLSGRVYVDVFLADGSTQWMTTDEAASDLSVMALVRPDAFPELERLINLRRETFTPAPLATLLLATGDETAIDPMPESEDGTGDSLDLSKPVGDALAEAADSSDTEPEDGGTRSTRRPTARGHTWTPGKPVDTATRRGPVLPPPPAGNRR